MQRGGRSAVMIEEAEDLNQVCLNLCENDICRLSRPHLCVQRAIVEERWPLGVAPSSEKGR